MTIDTYITRCVREAWTLERIIDELVNVEPADRDLLIRTLAEQLVDRLGLERAAALFDDSHGGL